MTFVAPAVAVRGALALPGDKSISHRAVLVGAICEGETEVAGFGRSLDTEATIAAVRALGVEVVEDGSDRLRVRGVGLRGLKQFSTPGLARGAPPARPGIDRRPHRSGAPPRALRKRR